MRWNDASMLKRQQKCDCRMECVGAQAKAQCMDASLWSNLEESFQLFLIFFLDFEENFCVLSSSIINDSSSFLILSSDPPHFYFNLAHHLGLS